MDELEAKIPSAPWQCMGINRKRSTVVGDRIVEGFYHSGFYRELGIYFLTGRG